MTGSVAGNAGGKDARWAGMTGRYWSPNMVAREMSMEVRRVRMGGEGRKRKRGLEGMKSRVDEDEGDHVDGRRRGDGGGAREEEQEEERGVPGRVAAGVPGHGRGRVGDNGHASGGEGREDRMPELTAITPQLSDVDMWFLPLDARDEEMKRDARASVEGRVGAGTKEGESEMGEGERGETWEEYVRRRTREFNEQTRERPLDEALWLQFAAFQVGLREAQSWVRMGMYSVCAGDRGSCTCLQLS